MLEHLDVKDTTDKYPIGSEFYIPPYGESSSATKKSSRGSKVAASPGSDIRAVGNRAPPPAEEPRGSNDTRERSAAQMPPMNWLDILKPGNKLPNGVVIWDVRVLVADWKKDDFLDFLFVVDDVYWNEEQWQLQQAYLVQLAKAYPVGPRQLAGLVREWGLTREEDLVIDLINDHPVSLAEKTYTRTIGAIYTEAQKEEFRVALGE
ncbi:hypothetical protein F5883DRAFT_722769 [Diaporthe sp. PMI_573]|nr:hypothetical protein F5883DRAFT_722769 [Diaporthaceae sp. PMI_573]